MIWFLKPKKVSETALKDRVVFEFLDEIINRKDRTEPEFERLKQASLLSVPQYVPVSVSVYFALEKFITEHNVPDVKEKYDRVGLRQTINTKIDTGNLNEKLKVIFMQSSTHKIYLYELYIKELVKSFTEALGNKELKHIHKDHFFGSLLETVEVKGDNFDFTTFNKKHLQKPEAEIDASHLEIRDIFKSTVMSLYQTTEKAFGVEFAKTAATEAFDAFAKYYDFGIIRSLLDIVPTGVSETQRLMFLSREELESEVEEKSKRLNEIEKEKRQLAEQLSRDLETKVQERTKDLSMFKLAVENATDHIVITDANANIIYANKAAEKVTGYKATEMTGKTPALWGTKSNTEVHNTLWQSIKGEKKPFNAEITNRRKNGEEYIADVHIAPVLDEETKEPIFYVGIERDITREKEIDKMKSEFIAVAAHQLRTPLTEIKWAFYSLLSETETDKLSEEKKNISNTGLKAADFTIDLVNNFLNVTQIDTGELNLDIKKQSAEDLVSELRDTFAKVADEKKVNLTFSVEPKLPQLSLDKNQILMALGNLVDNAIKYTPEGGKVNVSIRKNDNGAEITVSDTGIGIPAAQLDLLFKKFFRADNAKLAATNGTGLGLYIAKKIILEHKGDIEAASEIGKGTRFTVSLPFQFLEFYLTKYNNSVIVKKDFSAGEASV